MPVKIPANAERDIMIEKVSNMIEKRDAVVDNPKARDAINKQIDNMKEKMATFGITTIEDHLAQNEWFDKSQQHARDNAHDVPNQNKKANVIPEADASSSWAAVHKTSHQCSAVMCDNAWVDTGMSSDDYSHISVIIDTVVSPYTFNTWQVVDNLSWSFLTANTQGWTTLTTDTGSVVLNKYKSLNWAFLPWESNQWLMFNTSQVLQEDDVYYSTIRVTET